MIEEETIFQNTIQKLKSNYKLIPDRTGKIDFKKFTSLTIGDNFKINYQWKIEDNEEDSIYLISLYNSYRLRITKPELDRTIDTRTSKYFVCFLEFNFDFPDTIIRPKEMVDKLLNVFLHYDYKLNSRPNFHKKFILETNDKTRIDNLLNEKLTGLLENTTETIIEIRDNCCLVMNLRPVNYEDTIAMIEIVKELNKTNKIVA